MLILQMDVNEGAVITLGGVRMRVHLIEIRSTKKVRLGFTAPREATIHRDEIQRQIDGANAVDARQAQGGGH